MSIRTLVRWIPAVVAVMFAGLACSSSIGHKVKASPASKALARGRLFAGLTDAQRGALGAVAVLRRGKAGERIVEQGKPLDRMFILLEGRAEVRVNGKRVTTISGQPLVGEIEFLDPRPASADVFLLEDTDLIELGNAALDRLMEKQPRLGYALMREIARIEARRLRDMNPK